MVPNLPYFMVQFDYKGEKGYGHVIEGTSEASGNGDEDIDEGEKGGGEFPRCVPYLLATGTGVADADHGPLLRVGGSLLRLSVTSSTSSPAGGEDHAGSSLCRIRNG